MDWVIVSIASAGAFAIVSIFDKVILVRYVPSAPTFIALTGLLQLPGPLIALAFLPPKSHPFHVWLTAYLSGLCWGVSLYIMFWGMSTREVSRVIAVVSASPVFVAILSVVFLSVVFRGGDLGALHWGAIVVMVAGAALISLRAERAAQRIGLDSSFYLLIVASILVAGGQFLSKVVLDEDL